MRVAFLGPPGTFSDEAARTAPGAEPVPASTLPDVVAALAAGEADRAVVPIENSTEGSVDVTLDLLAARHDVEIVGELVLPVAVHLVARAPLALDAVERVLSHPQPLGQCAAFLRARLPGAEVAPTASTAEAVRAVMGEARPWAALASRRAAELYGAAVLAEGVEDEPGNVTRFVWLARTGEAASPPPAAPAKTSLTFWGEGDASPGWLVRCLSEFAFRGVNLSRIESRPLRGRLGHYRFFLDCDGEAREGPVAEAVRALEAHCEEVRVLGSYRPAGELH
jgi:prephenate dehydratase